ncbi:hypothetical protein [Sphingobium sp. EM0848]|uniref:hypothetical protein n=1 Tax=Sphingobium sp. EM0848 TaxID=2743473 RepID=UPI00159C647C|nr:hypothetical protein [Sphingobium sp. EM0848]
MSFEADADKASAHLEGTAEGSGATPRYGNEEAAPDSGRIKAGGMKQIDTTGQ